MLCVRTFLHQDRGKVGVGAGEWQRVDGFSEAVITWIAALEANH